MDRLPPSEELLAEAELRELYFNFVEELMQEPPGGHNHGRKKTDEGGWQPLETDPRDVPSRKRETTITLHGTSYAYQKLRCRCAVCRAWKAGTRK